MNQPHSSEFGVEQDGLKARLPAGLQVRPTFARRFTELRRLGLVLILMLVSAGSSFAANVPADFAAANELYARGNFAAAATAYEQILQSGAQSVPLLFNCGNAEFKAGHLGRAIVAFRRAALLEPRAAELRANLAFVRNQVSGSSQHPGRWQDWFSLLTLNEGAVLTAVLLWVLFALLAIRQIRPALVPRLRAFTRATAVLTVCSAAVLALQATAHFNASVAVVTGPEATARSGPLDDAQSVFTIHDGAELRVLDRHDGWVQAADAAGKIGWLNTSQVTVMPAA
jgi:tetratricopeptide (TPR) repeat protein